MIAKFLLPFLLVIGLNADSLELPSVVMDAIVNTEAYKENGVINPYVVCLNTKADIQKATEYGMVVDGRAIKCKSEELCVETVLALEMLGIKNVDVGAYQINLVFHPTDSVEDYFNMDTARASAEAIVLGHIKRDGYTWESIAKYHSGTPELNRRYAMKLYSYVYKETN